MKKNLNNFTELLQIMDRLRKECPWDREQTMLSLRNNTIEECFELTEAILTEDMAQIREELGDLLLHIVFYAKIADEKGAFDLDDIAKTLNDKLIYRHPHVFGTTQANDTKQVTQNWEALKLKKKSSAGTLSGVPRGMPALPKAFRIGQKAASAGFDWQKREDVWAKVKEEIAEVEQEIDKNDHERLTEEFGDLFFALTNAARLYNIDPEAALERTNQKFTRRFEHIEERAKEQKLTLREMSLEQMDALWDEAKVSQNIK